MTLIYKNRNLKYNSSFSGYKFWLNWILTVTETLFCWFQSLCCYLSAIGVLNGNSLCVVEWMKMFVGCLLVFLLIHALKTWPIMGKYKNINFNYLFFFALYSIHLVMVIANYFWIIANTQWYWLVCLICSNFGTKEHDACFVIWFQLKAF